jgi:hypothetical protein
MYTGTFIDSLIELVTRVCSKHAQDSVKPEPMREFTDYQLKEHLYGSDNAQG